jgi:hypothetical protein
MLDEVEVGRHFKYSLQGVWPQYCSLAIVATGIFLALTFTSKLHSTLVLPSVWVLSSREVGEETTHTFV